MDESETISKCPPKSGRPADSGAAEGGATEPGEVAKDIGDKAMATAEKVGDRVKEQARKAGDQIKEQGRTFLEEQKSRVATEIQAYSTAARRAADRLEEGSDTQLSGYVASAADRLERLGSRIEERDLGGLVDDVEDIARRRPEVFFGGMFVAGLVAARFLKASKQKRERERYRSHSDPGSQFSGYRGSDAMSRTGVAATHFNPSPEPQPVGIDATEAAAPQSGCVGDAIERNI